MNREKTLLAQWGGAGGQSKRTFSVVGRVLDNLLVALELGRDDLVPGDPQLVVDVDGMLRLLGLVDLQTAHDKDLEGGRRLGRWGRQCRRSRRRNVTSPKVGLCPGL